MSSRSDTDNDTEGAVTGESTVAADPTATPAAELVARTRQEEARLAVATAASLIEQGVSPSNIVIATADGDQYEDALTREAERYGRTLAVWTPLNIKRTVPYQLISACLEVLAIQGEIDIATLTHPLTLGWMPAGDRSSPLSPANVNDVVRAHAGVERSVADWTAVIAATDIERPAKRHWIAYLNWVRTQPKAPTSKDITETLKPVIARYDDAVLPETPGDESVSELAARIRAVERTTELITTTRKRYASLLGADRITKQWGEVNELLDAFASAVPGKRELPTAAAIDVKEANDLWALSVPYVIAVGLVDEEWPTTPASPVPSAARTVIETADIDGVRPHSAWTTARDRDQFEAAYNTATTALIVTRHTTDADGVKKRASRFLEGVETARVPKEAQDRLMAEPSVLPEPLRDSLPMEAHDE